MVARDICSAGPERSAPVCCLRRLDRSVSVGAAGRYDPQLLVDYYGPPHLPVAEMISTRCHNIVVVSCLQKSPDGRNHGADNRRTR